MGIDQTGNGLPRLYMQGVLVVRGHVSNIIKMHGVKSPFQKIIYRLNIHFKPNPMMINLT